MFFRGAALVLFLGAFSRNECVAQGLSHRGYLETVVTAYPQTAPGDSGRWIGHSILRYEPSYKLNSNFRFQASFDARADTHHQAQRDWDVSFWDRTAQWPAFAVRQLSASYSRGPVSLEIGKQFVRWGKTDILNPTDRFAPRDYLVVVDNEFLGVTAARLTLASQSDSLELVFTPRLTPSRTPLLNQRWVVIPPAAQGLGLNDAGALYPGGPQYGARWNHQGSSFESSFSFFQGFNHLPLLDTKLVADPLHFDVLRSYAKIRVWGADVAAPLPWFTVKGEAAWFQSFNPHAGEYVLYVVQLERQHGEWLFIGGYAGERVTKRSTSLSFNPERGLARSFVGRASYTIDTNRSVTFEGLARQDGEGFYLKSEYSHAFGQHWRLTGQAVLLRGSDTDFIGQYHRNSFGAIKLRYSF
jgi:hypothetical protein